jgi:branched-chain amino acid aminotransferase
MQPVPLLDERRWIEGHRARRDGAGAGAAPYAMYSSVAGGITTDPALMSVPVDDHLVHRGDGVFETIKCVDGAFYGLDRHLDRLQRSAAGIGLAVPCGRDALHQAVVATVLAGGRRDALVRVLFARGPGGMGVNPYETGGPQLYIVAYRLPPPFMASHPGGARAAATAIPVKAGLLATIKTCNYLPNVLMKKEAVDRGVDFVLAFDEEGCLAESATENAGIVTGAGDLVVPEEGRILPGVTMGRVLQLAVPLAGRSPLGAVRRARIPRQELAAAAEILIFGTTPDVTSVVEWEGRPVGDGRPGPVGGLLAGLLHGDIAECAAMRTPLDGS